MEILPAPRDSASVLLAYNGLAIRDRGNMLSLTDMWRAAGEDPAKRPAEWSRSTQATEFVEFVKSNMGISHIEPIQTVRGGDDPGTWAHWQVAFAYAKYLSPEFHGWCNTVVRDHMEGRLRPVSGGVTEDTILNAIRELGVSVISPLANNLRQTADEVVRLGEKVDGIEQKFDQGLDTLGRTLNNAIAKFTKRRAKIQKDVERLHLKTLERFFAGRDLFDKETVIYDGVTFFGQWHHWKGDSAVNSLRDFIPVSKRTHDQIHNGVIRPEAVKIIVDHFYLLVDQLHRNNDQASLPFGLN